MTLISNKSVVGGVGLEIPELEEKKNNNQDWRSTSRQVAHGPDVSFLDRESHTSGIVSFCQSARIQVILQVLGLCLFSLGWPAMAHSALSHSGLSDY